MKPALTFLRRHWARIPDAVLLGICLGFAWSNYSKSNLLWFGFWSAASGLGLAFTLVNPVLARASARIDELRAALVLARTLINEQHQVFVDAGPHLEVIQEFFDRHEVAAPKRKEEVN